MEAPSSRSWEKDKEARKETPHCRPGHKHTHSVQMWRSRGQSTRPTKSKAVAALPAVTAPDVVQKWEQQLPLLQSLLGAGTMTAYFIIDTYDTLYHMSLSISERGEHAQRLQGKSV